MSIISQSEHLNIANCFDLECILLSSKIVNKMCALALIICYFLAMNERHIALAVQLWRSITSFDKN